MEFEVESIDEGEMKNVIDPLSEVEICCMDDSSKRQSLLDDECVCFGRTLKNYGQQPTVLTFIKFLTTTVYS